MRPEEDRPEEDRREEERGEGFLTRWSRRKRDIAAAEASPPPAAAPEAGPEKGGAAAEAEEEFDLSLLPDIETLTAESDITLFLKKGVPEALKNAALRRMWSADAAIRDYIGPVDYQWDFNDPHGVPGFGPLGSDVDVEALLRQVMGEPRKSEALAENANVPELEQSSYTKVEDDEFPQADGQVLEGASPSEITGKSQVVELVSEEEAVLAPAPRRHGGALPL
jgi:hypothetical protein